MGNAHSGSTLTRTTGALDSFVAELGGDIIYEKRYGDNWVIILTFCSFTFVTASDQLVFLKL